MDLHDEIEKLKEDLKKRDVKIEAMHQEIYSLKLNLNAKQGVEEHLQAEVESLQSALASTKSHLTTDYEKKLSVLTNKHREEVHDLESQLEELQTSNASMKKELESLKEQSDCLRDKKEIENLQQELKLTLDDLTDTKSECKRLNDEWVSARTQLATAEKELLEEREQQNYYKSKIESLKEELATVKEELETAQAYGQEARMELMAATADNKNEEIQVDLNKKGNSLFGELEDNRQKAIAALRIAHNETINARNRLAHAEYDLKILRTEYAQLKYRWKDFEDKEIEFAYLDKQLMQTHLDTIKKLEKKVRDLERALELKAQHKILDAKDGFEFLSSMRKNSQRRENELNNEIRELQLAFRLMEQNQLRGKVEERKMQAANMRLNAELDQLKLKIAEFSKNNPELSEPSSKPCRFCLNPSERRLPSFLVKKQAENKTVRFAEDTKPTLPFTTLADAKQKSKPIKAEVIHVLPQENGSS